MQHLLLSCLFLGLALAALSSAQELPKLYDYFTEGGINSGLVARDNAFWLNGKYIKIISGTIPYYRIHPDQLRNRFRKLRALGANAVETYNTWNIHEPRRGEFDFGNGANDMSEFLNLRKYVQLAQEEDLLVIMRPGPFINSEWEFGGLPSWLLRDANMKVRTDYLPYMYRAQAYINALLSEVVDLQFTKGGAIIALQIENEYYNFEPRSRDYLEFIRDAYVESGFNDSLFFTADNGGWKEYGGGIPGVLQTANAHDVDNAFTQMLEIQPDMPLMVTEFYPGWLNHWFDEKKAGRGMEDFTSNLEKALGPKYNGSINIYPFNGGSNFGMITGVNGKGEEPFINPVIQSYDFDACLSEAGDFTERYDILYDMVLKYENPKLWRPERPGESRKVAYPTVDLQEYLVYLDMIYQIPDSHKIKVEKAISMEELHTNNENGQSFGYIIYRTNGPFGTNDRFKVTNPKDFAQLIIDGDQVMDTKLLAKQNPGITDYWINGVKEIPLTLSNDRNHTVDIMIENLGRTSHGVESDFHMTKGLPSARGSKLELNDQEVENIEIISVEFTNAWVKSLTNWRSPLPNYKTPIIIRSKFDINGPPADTFLDMREWHKGIAFINGFNLGRYWKAGPQHTIYVPAELLKTGENEIVIFEQIETAREIKFLDAPILGEPEHP